jgi:hypothetical protein
MCTELLPPGGYPIAVNKYITSYQEWNKWQALVNAVMNLPVP